MRLLTRRIYRAFPELDRYSDEQCRRFVHAARRAFWPRIGRNAVRLLGLAIWFAVVIGAAWALGLYDSIGEELASAGVVRLAGIVAGAVAVFVVLPLVGWLLWRDVQLRRRIRKILRTRAKCPGCGYQLLGLFVNAEHKVVCVECGMETEVDPSLGELTTDEVGRARFNPAPAPPTWWQRKMTPRRKKMLLRSAIAAVLLVVIGGPGAWLGYEWFLRRQATRAKADRIGGEGILEFIEKRQPAGVTPDSPNAHESLEAAIALVEKARTTLWNHGGPATPSGREAVPDISSVYGGSGLAPTEEQREVARYGRAAGVMTIRAWEEQGVFGKLTEMAARPRAVRPLDLAPGEPLVMVALPTLGQTRNLARGCAARMYLAELAGDEAKYIESFESLMALSRVTSYQPFLIDELVAVAVESLGYSRLQSTLADHPSESWLAGIEGALERQRPSPREKSVEGERLSVLDTAAWLFSDPDNVRLGKYSQQVATIGAFSMTGTPGGRLGTYDENVRTLNEMFDRMEANAGLERWRRPPAMQDAEHPLVLVRLLMPENSRVLGSHDQMELSRRGLRVQIALARYWNTHRRYPERLDELVGVEIESLPLDPWSGKPLCYVRESSGYRLYSVGADGIDNAGMPAKSRYEALLNKNAVPEQPGGTGTDFLINAFERAEPLDGLPVIPVPAETKGPGKDSSSSAPDAPVN
ncbi:MAG: hypothetical protein IT438_09570 [Phycisphaerales bacterium]|nr:hypothetical protein [Phycisphaerales bacterium]